MKTPEFAELIGVSRQAVLEAIKRGRLPQSARKVKGIWHVDPEIGRAEWRANIDPSRRPAHASKAKLEPIDDLDGESGLSGDYPDFVESRAKREYHLAGLAELEHERLRGSLIPKEEVQKETFALARMTRDAMLNIPDRCAADLAAATDTFTVHARLTKEIKEALFSLVHSIEQADLSQ